MEMTAVIRGLEALRRPTRVEVVTDSVYVGKGFSEWLPKWKANGWRRREGDRLKPIKNEDLWRQLDVLLGQAPGAIHARPRPPGPSRRTSAATPWPWPPTRSSANAGKKGTGSVARFARPY